MMEEKIYVHGYLQLQEIHIFTYCKREKIYVEWEPPTEQVDIQTEFIDNLINKEQVEKIHNFLKNMKDPYKIVFELRIHGELSFEKIGRIFGKKFWLGKSNLL